MRSPFLPVGLVLVVFSCVMFSTLTGCSSGNALGSGQTSSSALQSTSNGPSEPTADELADPAVIKPAANAAAVFDGMEMVNTNGVVKPDAQTGFAVKYGGQDAASAGTLPLQQTATGIATMNKALFPEGLNTLAMVGGNLFLQEKSSQSAVHTNAAPSLKIKSINLSFSVNKGSPVTWTYPTSWNTQFTRQGQTYIAKGSFLRLVWDGKRSVPPSDGLVVTSVTAYYKGAQIWSVTHRDTVLRQGTGGFCDIVGHNNLPFDAIAVTMNLANTK